MHAMSSSPANNTISAEGAGKHIVTADHKQAFVREVMKQCSRGFASEDKAMARARDRLLACMSTMTSPTFVATTARTVVDQAVATKPPAEREIIQTNYFNAMSSLSNVFGTGSFSSHALRAVARLAGEVIQAVGGQVRLKHHASHAHAHAHAHFYCSICPALNHLTTYLPARPCLLCQHAGICLRDCGSGDVRGPLESARGVRW
jgi:hypothetical protein